MGRARPLSRPPIKEALIDVRLAFESSVEVERLKALHADLSDDYPISDEKRAFVAQLRVEAGKVLPPSTEDLGFAALVFSNSDKSRIVQVRRDGFTVNRLAGYTTADPLIADALRLFELYRRLVSPNAITRVAMRYINSLVLPYQHGEEVRKYLAAPPEMPDGAPQQVSSFFTRVTAHSDEADSVIVTQTLDHSVGRLDSPVTMDLDAFFQGELPPTEDALSAALSRLRILKNRTFFALLTEQALELYV